MAARQVQIPTFTPTPPIAQIQRRHSRILTRAAGRLQHSNLTRTLIFRTAGYPSFDPSTPTCSPKRLRVIEGHARRGSQTSGCIGSRVSNGLPAIRGGSALRFDTAVQARSACACPLHVAATASVTAPVVRRVGRVWDLALLGARSPRQHNEERCEPSVPVHRFLRARPISSSIPLPTMGSIRLASLFLTLPTRGLTGHATISSAG
jgi:hypothetical protein